MRHLSRKMTYRVQQIFRTSSRTGCNIFRARLRKSAPDLSRKITYRMQHLSRKITYRVQQIFRARWHTGCNRYFAQVQVRSATYFAQDYVRVQQIFRARLHTECNRSFAQDDVQGATDLSHKFTYGVQQIFRARSRAVCNRSFVHHHVHGATYFAQNYVRVQQIFRPRLRTECNRSFAQDYVQGTTDLSHKIVYTVQRSKFIRWTVWNFCFSTSSSSSPDVERYVTSRRKLTLIFSTYFRRSYSGGKFKQWAQYFCTDVLHLLPTLPCGTSKQLVCAGQVYVTVTCESKLTHKKRGYVHDKLTKITLRWRLKDQHDVNCYFISLLIHSTCFGH